MRFNLFLPFFLVGVIAAPLPAREQTPSDLQARSSSTDGDWSGFRVWNGSEWVSPPPTPPESPDRPPPPKKYKTKST
ncbi:hypothetical protein PspLS_07050 [Pyricularia sp. CBS 133598]|nr:hypothetical protein PspLS_07050 [Pyricularia sp. CBS 133598]